MRSTAVAVSVYVVIVFVLSVGSAYGFSFAGVDFVAVDTGFATGVVQPGKNDAPRWDAQDFTLGTGNIFNGRSISGGITYNYQSNFRTSFTWDTTPTQVAFDAAITSAFAVWSNSSPLQFAKVNTATVLTGHNAAGNNILGADIDLFARDIGGLGETAVYGITQAAGGNVILTNGVADYMSSTIAAADLRLDITPTWTLQEWTWTLIHELGHAIGLGDVDVRPFWDTNDTLNDAMAIDQSDPNATANLSLRAPAGFGGVSIQMETGGPLLPGLANDDLAGRTFLYPVPEPGTALLLGLGLVGLARKQRGR